MTDHTETEAKLTVTLPEVDKISDKKSVLLLRNNSFYFSLYGTDKNNTSLCNKSNRRIEQK